VCSTCIIPAPPVNCQFIWMASAFGMSATQPNLSWGDSRPYAVLQRTLDKDCRQAKKPKQLVDEASIHTQYHSGGSIQGPQPHPLGHRYTKSTQNSAAQCIEVVKKWLIQCSRFHTQYENDKMGLWCLQRKIHKTELLLRLSAGALPQTPLGTLQRSPSCFRGGAARGRK